ncbi:MAG: hypothetical protein AMQ22_00711 [Candidatus Methanofastidiosum methylothiophilum]|uniref:Uncharacterized protein n=1 Tax=Candidatus Methanofastidiosum methylothiophilum TaxID=1705564 RepID=A0A150J630_9EURY|nr:MAG: hypothetical protein AMQ22_00711 [Candidatus Methanofastidiosum methylthiophilus]
MKTLLMQMICDSNGKASPRRMCGIVIILLWLVLCITIIVYDIFTHVELSHTTLNVLDNMGWVGFGLLGISVVEFFKKKSQNE